MLPYRRTGGFFLRLLLAYALLIAAWPVLRGAYSAGYRAVGNVVFQWFDPHGEVRFLPFSDAGRKMDTVAHLLNRRTGFSIPMGLSSRLMGYVPTAEVIALILATPLPWSRRWNALLYGLILAHALALFRVTMLVLHGFSGTHEAALYAPGPFWSTILSAAYTVIAASLGFAFATPILVWILATFRRGDLERWRTALTKPDARAVGLGRRHGWHGAVESPLHSKSRSAIGSDMPVR
ncbi:MAG TPA: hypothetical protein VM243_07010 [Phycisphaerae bacterium]|nr:hypothetical protein [Phycisphaerae bacterium]